MINHLQRLARLTLIGALAVASTARAADANAIQAMPDGGELSVSLDVIGEAGARCARLRIADTGTGIAPEHLARLFQPFFSTKSRGLGFGLYLVKLIIEKHGGEIRAETLEGRGTCLMMQLPLETRTGTP